MDVHEWDRYVDRYGHAPDEVRDAWTDGRMLMARSHDGSPIADMSFPARCGCGQVYDLGTVEVTARYADCSMWTTPCCRRLTDSRPKGWCTGPGYTELRRPRHR